MHRGGVCCDPLPPCVAQGLQMFLKLELETLVKSLQHLSKFFDEHLKRSLERSHRSHS